MTGHLITFLLVSLVVIVTPGPDTALTIRNALRGGRGGGVATALGVATGQASWTVAASAGIASLLVASEPAFVALKLAGAAYLVFLGAEALLSALRSRGSRPAADTRDGRQARGSLAAAYRQGLFSNLGKPKMAVFFTSLLPQFAPRSGTSFFVLLPLGLVFCLLTLTWLTAYSIAVARAGDFLRRSRVRRALDALTGTVLVALGLRLAAEHHR